MPERIDLLLSGGTVLTMDDDGTMIEDGGVAVLGERIVAVAPRAELERRFEATQTIDARRHAIMPGLVDTYGHAGHAMIRAIFNAKHGWPAGQTYWHATTPEWWLAEAELAALERLRFGVTTGASIIGSTPARLDSPVFAEQSALAYARLGTRAVLGVGPPDPFIPHIPQPYSGSFLEQGRWVQKPFSYDDAVGNSIDVIRSWHGRANGRISIALAPAYLFGRHMFDNGRFVYHYRDADAAVVLAKAEEMRELADRHAVQIHTHMFRGSVEYALGHWGRETVERLLGPDVVVAHANGMAAEEVELLGATRVNIASAPSTGENVWYGFAPLIELLDAGANVAIATDGAAPRFGFDLWKEISRAMWNMWIAHHTQSVLPPGKALRMVTIDAARALGMHEQIGSLEAGKRADIITVDLDRPHLTPQAFVPQLLTYYVNGNDVDTVLVDGRVLLRGGVATGVDAAAILENARVEAARVFERIDLAPYTETNRAFWHGSRY